MSRYFDCFSDNLADFAKYYCLDETLGKDAFQDAMITALTKLDTYRGDSPIEPWLRRIVMSACSRLRRGRKNDPKFNIPLDADKSGSILTDTSPDQELSYMMVERLELVRQEIEKLKEPNRSLLMLHDIQEIPIIDLSLKYGMTEEAVKSRLKRARTSVRSNLLSFIE